MSISIGYQDKDGFWHKIGNVSYTCPEPEPCPECPECPECPPEPEPSPTKDVFGINIINPTIPNGRTFFAPTSGVSTSRVAAVKRIGTTEMVAHGQGGVTPGSSYYKLDGSAPRLYIYDSLREKKWNNVEITCYYNKASSSNVSYAGFVIGARSIHELGGSNAQTYYVKHHFTTKRITILKEHFHNGNGKDGYVDTYSSSLPIHELNDNKWYGMKFVLRTKSNGHVLMEVYRDMTDGANGGTWDKVYEYTDTGSFNDRVPYVEGTSCLFRTDGVTDFRIKNFSIRTIEGLP